MTTVDNLIAVIDDNAPGLRALGRLLSVHGFGTRLYASAEAFLAEPQASSASLALIDINLGNGMSGVELARTVRKTMHDLPIILMSACIRSITHAHAEQLPGVTILEKPFPTDALVEIIKISLPQSR